MNWVEYFEYLNICVSFPVSLTYFQKFLYIGSIKIRNWMSMSFVAIKYKQKKKITFKLLIFKLHTGENI